MAAIPKSQLWISVALLLWSLAGIAAFAGQYLMSPDDIAKLPQVQQDMWANMPGWAWTAYGVAVVTALLGALCLVLKRGLAVPLYAVSLIAVLVQFSYTFIVADGVQKLGASSVLFPAFIVLMGAIALVLARRWRAAGWFK